MKGRGKGSSANSSGMGKARGRAFGSGGGGAGKRQVYTGNQRNITGGTGSAKKMGGVLSDKSQGEMRDVTGGSNVTGNRRGLGNRTR